MNTTHTLGPWNLSGDYLSEIRNKDERLIAGINIPPEPGSIAEGNANARLIVAAPELLESAEEWLELWHYIREHYPDIELPLTLRGGSDACGRLRAAIAKAKGES